MQAHRIDVLASEIKLGDIYITHAPFALERRREVVGLREMVGPDESAYVELTLKRDAVAPNGSEASVPMRRHVTVERQGAWPYSHGPYFVRDVADSDRLVIRRRDEDHTRAVAYIDDIGQWERFTAALDAGLDEVAAVHAIDRGEGRRRPLR